MQNCGVQGQRIKVSCISLHELGTVKFEILYKDTIYKGASKYKIIVIILSKNVRLKQYKTLHY